MGRCGILGDIHSLASKQGERRDGFGWRQHTFAGQAMWISYGGATRASNGNYVQHLWDVVTEFGVEYAEESGGTWHTTETDDDEWIRLRVTGGEYTAPIPTANRNQLDWVPLTVDWVAFAEAQGGGTQTTPTISATGALVDLSVYNELYFEVKPYHIFAGNNTFLATCGKFVKRPDDGWPTVAIFSSSNAEDGWNFRADRYTSLSITQGDVALQSDIAASPIGTFRQNFRLQFRGTNEENILQIRALDHSASNNRFLFSIYGR